MSDNKIRLNELDDEDAIRVNAELAKAQNGSAHVRDQGVRVAERLDEGDLAESDAEELED